MTVPQRARHPVVPLGAAALILFCWLAGAAAAGRTMGFDRAVRAAVCGWASPAFTTAMKGITQAGSVPFVTALGVFAAWRLFRAGRGRAVAFLAAATAGAELLDQVLKVIFHRARPEALFGLAEPTTYSFPSGHALTATCFYAALAAIVAARARSSGARAALWCAALLLAGTIGFSRVYLGVHWATDVLGGYALAAVWLAALRLLAWRSPTA